MFEKEDRVAYVPRDRGNRRWYDPRSNAEARIIKVTAKYVEVEWLDPFRPEMVTAPPPTWYHFQPPVQNRFIHKRFLLVERKAGPW